MRLYLTIVVLLNMLPLALGTSVAHAGDWSDYDDSYDYNYDHDDDDDDYPGSFSSYYFSYYPSYSYSYRSSRECYRASRKVWSAYHGKYKRRRVLICD